jgi:hypothetical protein
LIGLQNLSKGYDRTRPCQPAETDAFTSPDDGGCVLAVGCQQRVGKCVDQGLQPLLTGSKLEGAIQHLLLEIILPVAEDFLCLLSSLHQ